MSGLHYNDAGSGPHDESSRINDRGERNCGCKHDGHVWLSLCTTARADWQARHEEASRARVVAAALAWLNS